MTDKQNYFIYIDNTSDDNDKTMENLHKQTIIHGCDVSGCEYYFDNICRCMDSSIMQDFYSCPQCSSNPNCYYKKWKRKEQACERLKHDNGYEVGALEKTIDNLKTDREEALKQLEFVRTLNTVQEAENRKLSKTLAEIKELIQSEYCIEIGSCAFCDETGDCLNRKILQKISEVIPDEN